MDLGCSNLNRARRRVSQEQANPTVNNLNQNEIQHRELLSFGIVDMAAMCMTRKEFIQRGDKQRKVSALWALVALAMLIGPIGFMAWLEPRHGDWPTYIWTILHVVMIVLMVAGVTSSFIIPSRLSKRLGLCCPECKKPLLAMSALVIATGRCGHCGGRVLDDAA
jgi:hypothetical protein